MLGFIIFGINIYSGIRISEEYHLSGDNLLLFKRLFSIELSSLTNY